MLLLIVASSSDCNHWIYGLHVLMGILLIGVMTLLVLALIVNLLLLVLASLLEDSFTLSGR